MNRLLIFTMLSTKYLLIFYKVLVSSATFLVITWAVVVLFSRTFKSLKSLWFDLELAVWTPWVLLNLQLKHVSKLLLKCWLLLSSDLNGFFFFSVSCCDTIFDNFSILLNCGSPAVTVLWYRTWLWKPSRPLKSLTSVVSNIKRSCRRLQALRGQNSDGNFPQTAAVRFAVFCRSRMEVKGFFFFPLTWLLEKACL